MSRSYKKPWIKDNPRVMKRIHARRYRRYIRQDMKQWRNRYAEGIIRYCGYYWEWSEDLFSEEWNWDVEVLYWRECLSFELEPSYDPRNKWIDPWDICDWRFYCEGPEYRRK